MHASEDYFTFVIFTTLPLLRPASTACGYPTHEINIAVDDQRTFDHVPPDCVSWETSARAKPRAERARGQRTTSENGQTGLAKSGMVA
jgi:hypothetical protein